MTRTEFQTVRGQHLRVCAELCTLLEENKMSLIVDPDGSIMLCDDGNDIGYTGDVIQEAS